MPRIRTKAVPQYAPVDPKPAPALDGLGYDWVDKQLVGDMGSAGKNTILTGDKPQVRMINVFHARMAVIKSLVEEKLALKEGVGGAYIKYMPTVRASERANVDTKAIRQRFIDAGAIAVVVAPVIVPDGTPEKAAQSPRAVVSAEQHLKAWFVGVKADKRIIEQALQDALITVGEAGL